MINLQETYSYKTVDGRDVMLLPKAKLLDGKKIYIGIVAGEQAYHHWSEDGVAFGTNDKQLNLKAA